MSKKKVYEIHVLCGTGGEEVLMVHLIAAPTLHQALDDAQQRGIIDEEALKRFASATIRPDLEESQADYRVEEGKHGG